MKKTYIKPVMTDETINVGDVICQAIITSGGDSAKSGGIKSADGKFFGDWDEEDGINLW